VEVEQEHQQVEVHPVLKEHLQYFQQLHQQVEDSVEEQYQVIHQEEQEVQEVELNQEQLV
jgi:hypothetical protein